MFIDSKLRSAEIQPVEKPFLEETTVLRICASAPYMIYRELRDKGALISWEDYFVWDQCFHISLFLTREGVTGVVTLFSLTYSQFPEILEL